MQISIKPICDWRIYLTASTDELLACLKQTSLVTATSIMGPFLATVAQNRITANSLLTCSKSHLPYVSTLSFIQQPNITFVSNSPSNPVFHCTVLSHSGVLASEG